MEALRAVRDMNNLVIPCLNVLDGNGDKEQGNGFLREHVNRTWCELLAIEQNGNKREKAHFFVSLLINFGFCLDDERKDQLTQVLEKLLDVSATREWSSVDVHCEDSAINRNDVRQRFVHVVTIMTQQS